MIMQMFYTYGKFCATHPWEVIFTILTSTLCIVTMDHHEAPVKYSPSIDHDSNMAVDLIIMTVLRCATILYSYYQFRKLQEHNSKYLLAAAALFTGFSTFMFTSTVLNVLQMDTADLKDALFFFLISTDLMKAACLAGFALRAGKPEDIKCNVATGLCVLGPNFTLDTLVETLVIGCGTLTGVQRIEKFSYFICLGLIINYIVFMTFYPAFLSLIMELNRQHYGEKNLVICRNVEKLSNPVAQRVKLIMSCGLFMVHLLSRCQSGDEHTVQNLRLNHTEGHAIHSHVLKWVTVSVDHIVILILLIALIIKYTYFENNEWELRCECKERKRHSSDVAVQTSGVIISSASADKLTEETKDESKECARDFDTALQIYRDNPSDLIDDEVIALIKRRIMHSYSIEKVIGDCERGVRIRRKLISENNSSFNLVDLPYEKYDYSKLMGACCENVIGFMPVPLGVAGPLNLDGCMYYVPMATTEGCLIASTNRGCRALIDCGVKSQIVSDGMTRGPAIRFPNLQSASEAVKWLNNPDNYARIKAKFDSTSRFARLIKLKTNLFGRLLFIRFVAKTGDAMGMNMLSKGTESALKYLKTVFTDMEIVTLSGNYCTDKKSAAINWIEGRGKSVICEAVVPTDIVTNILKTTVSALIDVNTSKNLIGSAAAGCFGGGCNAHASNIVTAIYIATGQDPAQNITSSNCMTLLESRGEDLYMTCTMPSIEIGTIGGGTDLPAQASCLEMLGVRGANAENPGGNAALLARIVCGTVLAGELSLLAALAAGHLVKSHLRHNRSTASQDICEKLSTNLN